MHRPSHAPRTLPRAVAAIALAGMLGGALASCERAATPRYDARADALADVPAGGVIDSALPVPELLARFRATVSDTPATLGGGETTPERLTRALLAAVAARDTVAVRALTVNRAEFAWLYYPESRYTHPPYELSPDLVWLTTSAASEKGAGRLLERYGGRALRFVAVACLERAEQEGPNSVLRGCRVRFAPGDSAPRELRLFGALLHRDGRYKFLSFANDL